MTKRQLRFWSKVLKLPGDGCWNWQGKKTVGGYGRAYMSRDPWIFQQAHRVAWDWENGPIPGGLKCLHRCDNPACVRPSHLFLGTQGDNMRDCARKGRLRLQLRPEEIQGEKNPNAKLTEALVREIRANKDGLSTCALAPRYGVSHSMIHMIRTHKRWRHVA